MERNNETSNWISEEQIELRWKGTGVVNNVKEEQNDSCWEKFKEWYRTHFLCIKQVFFPTLFTVGYLVYVGFAFFFHAERAVFACVILIFVLYIYINKLSGGSFKRALCQAVRKARKCMRPSRKRARWTRRILTVGSVISILVFLVIDIWDQWEKWTPLGGLALFVIGSVVFSKHPTKINWTPVIWGMILQFCLGLLILRWERGFTACKFVGDQVTTMLAYTNAGSKFVFGEQYEMHLLAFKILPVLVFFGAIVSVLYYLGAMQITIKSIAIVLQYALDTTPIESFATSAHIFFGFAETTTALKPFWSKLTISELHASMTSGFATVAGLIIAAYVEFGVPAEHVISASFMSAPAALAIAKISYPETEVSQIKSHREIHIPTGQEANVLEALSVGAASTIKIIGYVIVNLIAFITVLAFLDAVVSYFGSLVDYPELSLQVILSYLFMPLAAVIGVPWSESKIVGALLGKKLVLNELIAFADLGDMINSGSIQGRASVLATYALCGFGSISAMGIYLGSLTSAAPDRRSDFARVVVRALINGNIACFMTACIAGLLYQDQQTNAFVTSLLHQTLSNSTANDTVNFNTTQSTLV